MGRELPSSLCSPAACPEKLNPASRAGGGHGAAASISMGILPLKLKRRLGCCFFFFLSHSCFCLLSRPPACRRGVCPSIFILLLCALPLAFVVRVFFCKSLLSFAGRGPLEAWSCCGGAKNGFPAIPANPSSHPRSGATYPGGTQPAAGPGHAPQQDQGLVGCWGQLQAPFFPLPSPGKAGFSSSSLQKGSIQLRGHGASTGGTVMPGGMGLIPHPAVPLRSSWARGRHRGQGFWGSPSPASRAASPCCPSQELGRQWKRFEGEKFQMCEPLLLGRARFVLFIIIHLLAFGGMPRFLQFCACGCVIY